jgi:hypothetical protein
MIGGNLDKCNSEMMHRIFCVRGPVSVRRDSANFCFHPSKQGTDELVVKSGVWVDGDPRKILTRQHHECFRSSLPSDGRVVHNKYVYSSRVYILYSSRVYILYSSRKVIGHEKYPEALPRDG